MKTAVRTRFKIQLDTVALQIHQILLLRRIVQVHLNSLINKAIVSLASLDMKLTLVKLIVFKFLQTTTITGQISERLRRNNVKKI